MAPDDDIPGALCLERLDQFLSPAFWRPLGNQAQVGNESAGISPLRQEIDEGSGSPHVDLILGCGVCPQVVDDPQLFPKFVNRQLEPV